MIYLRNPFLFYSNFVSSTELKGSSVVLGSASYSPILITLKLCSE